MKWRDRVKHYRREVRVLYRAMKDPRTPWYARALLTVVVLYALSPIDLIPDFIPVLGLLDDMIIVPVGIYFVSKMVPAEVIEEHRRRVDEDPGGPNG